eukprot:6795987-Prymnesium_polylepis.1
MAGAVWARACALCSLCLVRWGALAQQGGCRLAQACLPAILVGNVLGHDGTQSRRRAEAGVKEPIVVGTGDAY